jgi:hypothetical protein
LASRTFTNVCTMFVNAMTKSSNAVGAGQAVNN